jgi:hypothetical protein
MRRRENLTLRAEKFYTILNLTISVTALEKCKFAGREAQIFEKI